MTSTNGILKTSSRSEHHVCLRQDQFLVPLRAQPLHLLLQRRDYLRLLPHRPRVMTGKGEETEMRETVSGIEIGREAEGFTDHVACLTRSYQKRFVGYVVRSLMCMAMYIE